MRNFEKNIYQAVIILILLTGINSGCKKSTEPEEIEKVPFRNGDFEEWENGLLKYWTYYGPDLYGFECAQDTQYVMSGYYSTRIKRRIYIGGTGTESGLVQEFTDFKTGNPVQFSIYLKTRLITEGSVALNLSIIDASGLTIRTAAKYDIDGTRDWEKHTLSISSIPSDAEKIRVLLFHAGNEIVWFDKASLVFE